MRFLYAEKRLMKATAHVSAFFGSAHRSKRFFTGEKKSSRMLSKFLSATFKANNVNVNLNVSHMEKHKYALKFLITIGIKKLS